MRLFPSRTLLGIEVTASQIKLVEADPSSFPIKVHNFFSTDLLFTEPARVAEQLRSVLKRRKISARSATIAIPGPGIRYQPMDFPSMPASELRAVVERELRRLYPAQEGSELRWERLDEVEIGGRKRQRVLVVAAPSALVSQYRAIVEEAGLMVTGMTSVPLALLDFLGWVREGQGKRVCLVHIGEDRGYLIFARSGQWNFYREFFLKARGAGTEENPFERVSTEANLALLYDREHSAGEKVDAILLSGEGNLAPLREALEKTHRIPARLVRLAPGVDFAPVGSKAASLSQAVNRFVVPLGLIARLPQEREINLLPQEALTQRIMARRKAMVTAAGVVALFLLAGISFGLSFRARSDLALVEGKRAEAQRLSTFVRMAEERRKQAEVEQEVVGLMMGRMPRDTAWTEVFHTLGLAVPEEVLLHSLEMKWESGVKKWRVALKGEALGHSAFIAQNGLHTFIKALTKSPHFKQVEHMSFALSPVDGDKKIGQKTSGSEEEGGKSKVTFEVRFQLRG